jgi:hypothetical protein
MGLIKLKLFGSNHVAKVLLLSFFEKKEKEFTISFDVEDIVAEIARLKGFIV